MKYKQPLAYKIENHIYEKWFENLFLFALHSYNLVYE